MTPQEMATWLAERLDKIEGKVDGVKDHCAAIDITLTRQAGDIEHHIRRTDALEERVEQVAQDIAPIKDHVARLKGIAWLMGGLTALAGAAATIKSLLGI